MSTTHALYRFWSKRDELLYVGITVDPGNRWKTHSKDKPWWHDVARVTIEKHNSREAVLEAERAAIIAERPLHNIVHNRRRQTLSTRTTTRPQAYDSAVNLWTYRSLRSGYKHTTDLYLYGEINGTAMSDDWLPDEISANELLRQWVSRYAEKMTSIYWSVLPIHETAPFQIGHAWLGGRDFLSYFTWPEHAHTGEQLNWNALPVLDGVWDESEGTKGGFFQQATGWKPAPLQPYVDIPQVLTAAGLGSLVRQVAA